eukprot:TRINITY_DN7258_c0_g1_i1.p1 TRINITY_DN7258_c0_g1~~TRINITY_DN7258_c0_g1_i1.p1  ORF type:complete len:427 (+),score=91.65 TRINITY_DN7258_c0_g1_i1:94-1374(+)
MLRAAARSTLLQSIMSRSHPSLLEQPKRSGVNVLRHLRIAAGSSRTLTTTPARGSVAHDNDDEYGNLEADGLNHIFDRVTTESGATLHEVAVNYKTFGKLNEAGDNAMIVCHALTGNASLDAWWGELLGPQRPFDTDKYFVVCANILGSCYGTCGPSSLNPKTERPYGSQFPDVTVRDSVRLHARLVTEVLGVRQIHCVIGGSLGGMQTLEWAALEHDWRRNPTTAPRTFDSSRGFVQRIVPMACGADHSAWQIAFGEAQRQAIYADPHWHGGDYFDQAATPTAGLGVARQMAMISYRTPQAYRAKFGRAVTPDARDFQVEAYLHYQGDKFNTRFDAASYVAITKLMDTHDLGRDRGGLEAACAQLTLPTLVIGISSDLLYSLDDQRRLAQLLPNARLEVIQSDHGHDGFLLEQTEVSRLLQQFLA